MSIITRAGAAFAAVTLSAGAALAGASAAQAAPNARADAAAGWLADQLTNGVVHNDQYDFDDYGLTADLALAFEALDTQSEALGDIVDAFEADPTAYTTGEAFGDTGSQYAGQTAKLATVVHGAGGDATSFGGHDLIAELAGVVVDDGDEAGRGVDTTPGTDYSNTIGQSFVVRALAGAGNDERDAAVAYLLKQQCDTGAFRINMFTDGSVARECGAVDDSDSVSVDATGVAVAALIDAQDAGETGLADDIDDAAQWLLGVQASDGSFSDAGAANTNSTGLAAAALAATGHDESAHQAASWIADHQVGPGTENLEDESGAVAFDDAALDLGKDEGIVTKTSDQWTRATSQAVLGLNLLAEEPEPGPVHSMTLTISPKSPSQGDTITVTANGKDADGTTVGDVSDDITLASSVESDTIEGTSVTFNHASPHVLTATHTPTGTTATVTVQVAAAAGVDDPSTGGSAASDGSGASGSGLLPETGSSTDPSDLMTAIALVLAGTVLVVATRPRRHVGTHVRVLP